MPKAPKQPSKAGKRQPAVTSKPRQCFTLTCGHTVKGRRWFCGDCSKVIATAVEHENDRLESAKAGKPKRKRSKTERFKVKGFNKPLNPAEHEEQPVPTECPKCGSALKEVVGRYGPFLGCTRFPHCKGAVVPSRFQSQRKDRVR